MILRKIATTSNLSVIVTAVTTSKACVTRMIRSSRFPSTSPLFHSKPSRKRRRRAAWRFELLESRQLFAADLPLVVERPTVNLTPQEQLLVEAINATRAAPLQTAQRLGIDLNAGVASDRTITADAKPPLAIRQALVEAAELHSWEMLEQNQFAHVLSIGSSTSTPASRAASEGYVAPVGENIAIRSSSADLVADVLATHDQLFVSPGHRLNLLRDDYHDLGVGLRQGNFHFSSGATLPSLLTTEMFGITSVTAITGVVYDDRLSDNNHYDAGEGLTGITIDAVDAQGTIYRVRSGASGGYTLDVPNGTYTLTASGPGLSGIITRSSIQVAGRNVKIDFTNDQGDLSAGGESTAVESLLPVNLGDYDVSGDGQITPSDPLLVLNFLNSGAQSFERSRDVTGDGVVAPNDALWLLNLLNTYGNGIIVPQQATLAVEPSSADSAEPFAREVFSHDQTRKTVFDTPLAEHLRSSLPTNQARDAWFALLDSHLDQHDEISPAGSSKSARAVKAWVNRLELPSALRAATPRTNHSFTSLRPSLAAPSDS